MSDPLECKFSELFADIVTLFVPDYEIRSLCILAYD
jgi:hypothetical protein